uniref:Immunoglobulin domain-containing protein n=1 Tax=Sinocyclocheilus grahami TaxID=75366 RepID=A0A672TCV8_SINGR
MSDECHLCLLGLIVLSSLLTGSSGVDDAHVFISSGEDVRLSCNNALHDCKSTAWNYNSYSAAVELIYLGIKKKDTERHERLSLGSDCSLNIRNISKEYYGFYTCRQYVNREQQGPDARVDLHVLHVSSSSSSSSSSQTEISAGRSVTLFCQLYSFAEVSCGDLIRSERIELFWVNQADHNREWRCEVTQRDQVKSSVTYTVKSSESLDSVHLSIFPAEILIILKTAVFAAPTVILLQILCARRAGRKDSQHPEEIEINTILV